MPSAGLADQPMPDHRHVALVRLLRTVQAAATTAEDRRGAIALVVGAVCRYIGWPLGHAYIVDPRTGRLLPSMVWYDQEPGRYTPFRDATAGIPGGSRAGMPGHALSTRRPVWVTDVSEDPHFLRVDAARAVGIRSAVAVPVFVNGGVGAVLEFFSPVAASPDEATLAVLHFVGAAWGRVLELSHLEEELTHHEARFQALVESAADAIILAGDDGRILSWNSSARRMFGYAFDEVVGQPLTMIMPERYRAAHTAAFRAALERGPDTIEPGIRELEGLAKGGRVFPVELSLASWQTDRRYVAGILRDVTERRAVEEELRLLGSAAAHIHDAVVVSTGGVSGQGPTILYVNAAFLRMTGYSEGEVLGRSFGLLAGGNTDRKVLGAVNERLRRGEPASAELVAYRKDGSEFLLDWQASPIYEPDGTVRNIASIQRDVTETRRVEQALKRVDHDPLTGLANRELLERRLGRSIARSAERKEYRFALLFLDLDGFKAVNDEHGHVVGDQLLTSASRRLEHTVRPGDTLARFGGDEFVILLESVTDISDVVMVARRVQERLGTPFDIQGRVIRLAASVGVALSESGYSDGKQVIRDADAAMYEAKRRGKGRVEFFDRSLYRDVVSAVGLRDDLERCVDRNELELEYQPLVELGSREVIGFEALVRWRHPELGLLHPERFIPLAEETGHIVAIGRWVLREACATAGRWGAERPGDRPLGLSVNLSMRELASSDLVAAVRAILAETGFPARQLQLELTESVFVEGIEPVRSRVAALRALGIKMCIDDFGTGYSSLAYLQRFAVDKIKIDRLFVHDLEGAPGNVEILRTILALARNLDLDVVAEGVETAGQLECLKELACAFGQGFLFSRPLTPEGVEKLLAGAPGTVDGAGPPPVD